MSIIFFVAELNYIGSVILPKAQYSLYADDSVRFSYQTKTFSI